MRLINERGASLGESAPVAAERCRSSSARRLATAVQMTSAAVGSAMTKPRKPSAAISMT